MECRQRHGKHGRQRVAAPAGADELWSIGHSNHEIGHFIALLRAHGVAALADVRTAPFSRYSPQFNRDALAQSLAAAGITYVFLARELALKPTQAPLPAPNGMPT